MPPKKSAPFLPPVQPLQTETMTKVQVESPVLLGTLTVCCLALLAVFGASFMQGLNGLFMPAQLAPGYYYVCIDSDVSNSYSTSTTSYLSPSPSIKGYTYEVFSSAYNSNYDFRTSANDDYCTGLYGRVDSCNGTGCNLVERYCKNGRRASNLYYFNGPVTPVNQNLQSVCPNGCTDGACSVTWSKTNYIVTGSTIVSNISLSSDGERQVIGSYGQTVSTDIFKLRGSLGGVDWSDIAMPAKWMSTANSANGYYIAAIYQKVTPSSMPVNYNNYMAISNDAGMTWKYPVNSFGAGWPTLVMSASGQYITVIRDKIYYSNNYGATFKGAVISGATFSLSYKAAAMTTDGKNQYFYDAKNILFKSVDYGQNWVAVTISDAAIKQLVADANAIPPYSAFKKIAISADGKYQILSTGSGTRGRGLYISNNYGVNWTLQPTFNGLSINHGVAISSDGKKMLVGAIDGLLYLSEDYGLSWHSEGVNGDWDSVAISGDGNIFMAVDSKTRTVWKRQ